MASAVSRRQLAGSEFSGIQPARSTVQPKSADALNNSDRLRLGYLTGIEVNTEEGSIEDRRQMLGLRPADGFRPTWLTKTGIKSEAEREGFHYSD